MNNNPYATNRAGKIQAPKSPHTGDPKVTRTVADEKSDLRSRSK